MPKLATAFVLAYHGCDESVANRLIGGSSFCRSANNYDWLGSGVYFWEANPLRGLEFAKELQKRKTGKARNIRTPSVVGAVIDLGFCLDLLSSNGISALKAAYNDLVEYYEKQKTPTPENHFGSDLLLRKLDCAVINHLHAVRAAAGLPPYQTVRGVFTEGEPIYPNAGFRAKTHIQICVIDPSCIKGVFRVPRHDLSD